ncbi:MAG: outer membrane beta-barrel protein [Oceanobacter sp.]
MRKPIRCLMLICFGLLSQPVFSQSDFNSSPSNIWGSLGVGLMSVHTDESFDEEHQNDSVGVFTQYLQGGYSIWNTLDIALQVRRWGADSDTEDEYEDDGGEDFRGMSLGARSYLRLPTPYVQPYVFVGRYGWIASFSNVGASHNRSGWTDERGIGLLFGLSNEDETLQLGLEYQQTEFDGLSSFYLAGVLRIGNF